MTARSRVFLRKDALSRLCIVGLGQVVPHVVSCGRAAGLDVLVLTSSRQVNARDERGLSLSMQARDLGAKVVEAKDLSLLQEVNAEGAMVLSFGSPWIFPPDLIARFEGRVINSHAAPLPEWRGGGGFSWRIMSDDRRGASCFHLVTRGIDDGDIILYRPYRFPKSLRVPREWEAHALKHEKIAVSELLQKLANGDAFTLKRQDNGKATYVPRLHTPTHSWIDWDWPAAAIERFVLAFSRDYPGARTHIKASDARIFDVRVIKKTNAHPFMSGLILRKADDAFVVQTRDALLRVLHRDIETEANIREGDRFWTPRAVLDSARETRVVYGPEGLLVSNNVKQQ